MKNRTLPLSGVALTMLLLGCSRASEPQTKANDFGFEQQMLAIFPKMEPGTVLKVCNTNGQPGDQGSLQFSIEATKPDPENPGKTIPTEPLSVEQQLAAILPFVDEHHSVNIRSITDKESGLPRMVFTIHPI
ncbi:MAG TPA: hypothetical protein PLY76_10135 [Flavobacteriales bacterium]|nr:hypothetical protein [Flavobacteriales bacterium]HRP82249.1 hypothetical protein [Flavobacteriales bacterium]